MLSPEESQFFYACQQGDYVVVERLLREVGISSNSCDEEGITGLHWAALGNHIGVVKLLLKYNAKRDAIGGILKATPLHWAIRHGASLAVAELLGIEVDENVTNLNSLSPISKLSRGEILHLVLIPDSQGLQALHTAAAFDKHFEAMLILCLVEKKNFQMDLIRNLEQNNNSNESQNVTLYNNLEDIEFDVDARDVVTGRTALTWACAVSLTSIPIITILLRYGANPNIVDNEHKTPLHWAVFHV